MTTDVTSTDSRSSNQTNFEIPPDFIIGVICFYSPLIIATLLSNSLVLLAVYREKNLRKRSNVFIVSLSVADFLTGLVGVPTAIVGRLIQNHVTCFTATRMVFFTAAFTFSAVSLFQLLAITVERYLAIVTPLVYHKNMTPQRYFYIITTVWILGIVFGIIPNIGSGNPNESVCVMDYKTSHAVRIFMLIFAIFIPVVLSAMGLMYFHIFRTARSQANRIAALRRALFRKDDNQTDEQSAQMKATTTTAIILGGFAACWMPMSLKFFIEASLELDPYAILLLQTILEFPAYANSVMNPLIYSYRSAEFRTACCRMLAPLKLCKRNKVEQTPVLPFSACSVTLQDNCVSDDVIVS